MTYTHKQLDIPPTGPGAGGDYVGKPMPDQLWAVHHETNGSVMIGEWADTIRHIGGVEYVRADLATPTAHEARIAELEAKLEEARTVLNIIASRRSDCFKHDRYMGRKLRSIGASDVIEMQAIASMTLSDLSDTEEGE